MARPPRARIQTSQDETARWFEERDQALRRAHEFDDAGREAWAAATRRGIVLSAQTPYALRALGARVLSEQPSAIPTTLPEVPGPEGTAQPSISSRVEGALREAALQADTAVRGAANTVTFDQADKFAAAGDALFQRGGIDDWGRRYQANLAEEQARNRYDATHRALAQHIGQVAGGLLGVFAPAGGAVSSARLAGATKLSGGAAKLSGGAAKLSGREAAALAGAGGVAGAAAQIGSDAVTGQQSSVANTAGAALGGVANMAAMPFFGPARAGAIGNAASSVAQDVFNGRPVSFERAGQGAIVGRALGRLGAKTGEKTSGNLSPQAKGRLGEAIGNARSTVNGMRREWGPKARDPIGEGLGYWYPDGRSGSVRFEDKFGYGARLTPNQIRAQAALGADFVLYHSTPADVGRLFSVPAAAAGYQIVTPRHSEK